MNSNGLRRTRGGGPFDRGIAMQSQPQCLAAFRELDYRANDGIDVRLLWRSSDNRLLVAVSDSKSGDAFTVDVGPHDRPLDVFHHPYAYAAGEASGQRQPSGDAVYVKQRAREQAWDVR
jgi:hypothetical protein